MLVLALTHSRERAPLLSMRCMAIKELDLWKTSTLNIPVHLSQQIPGLGKEVCLDSRDHYELGQRSIRSLIPGLVFLASCLVFRFIVGACLLHRFTNLPDLNTRYSQYIWVYLIFVVQIQHLSSCPLDPDYLRNSDCPLGFTLFKDFCYRLSSQEKTFAEAEVDCSNGNGDICKDILRS